MTHTLRPGIGSTASRPRRTSAHRSLVVRALVAVTIALSLLILAGAILHVGPGVGLAGDSLMPWSGVWVVVPLAGGLVLRRGHLLTAAIVFALVWGAAFVPDVTPWAARHTSSDSLVVVSQNVHTGGADAAVSARKAVGAGADLIALEELDGASRDAVGGVLDDSYRHYFGTGTVGLWSRYPLEHVEPLRLGLGWRRAIRADVRTPAGTVGIVVLHAASARPFAHGQRDRMLARLAEMVANDRTGRLLVVGDFNAGSYDPALRPLQAELSEPRPSKGGFGFTWPARLPVIRVDHVFYRGLVPLESRTFRAGASDHRAVRAVFGPRE